MEAIFTLLLKQLFTKSVSALWDHKGFLWLYIRTLFGKYRNKEIRFSLSYLIRIRIPNTNRYLLVMNRRIENQLQPVGGVYKRYGDDKLFEAWDFRPDNTTNGLGLDKLSEQDLRFRIKGKYVIKAIKWFEEGKEREISADREFCEELLQTGILSGKKFDHIKYKQLKRFSKNLVWSDYHQCYEVLIYDVFELIPSLAQQEALIALDNLPLDLSRGFATTECADIEQLRLCIQGKQLAKIGHHSKLIINQTF
ncbi:SMODS-associated NUDIX domain-containing protein [Pedobacter nototheniae]|uniref:SMODS-associated NUDIX domain-containing protein n=1 Tax=Pedobacter nototheniae TaxID=2488994 RepID=UPI00103A97BC|nr:hypothetical protein [Pedobacter nototheniae]